MLYHTQPLECVVPTGDPGSGLRHRYGTYGLCIASDLAVPWLPAGPDRAPDVTIRLGPVPGAFGDGSPFWEARPGTLRLSVDGLARYLVTGGSRILVEPAGGDEYALAVFLVGSVLAACLQQRGVLTLHAGAVETKAGAALFLGQPGAGKSTLIAALIERGYALLADDLTGVLPGRAGRAEALSAFPRLRLWADAADALALRERAGRWQRVRPGLDKYLVPVDRFCPAPRTVRTAYILVPHNRDTIDIERLGPGDAVSKLSFHTYQRGFLRGLGLRAAHFHATAALARQAPVASLTRPMRPARIGALADRVEQDMRGIQEQAVHGWPDGRD